MLITRDVRMQIRACRSVELVSSSFATVNRSCEQKKEKYETRWQHSSYKLNPRNGCTNVDDDVDIRLRIGMHHDYQVTDRKCRVVSREKLR